MTQLDYAAYCDCLVEVAERFARLTRGQDMAIQVGTCPGWTLARLVRHTGSVHRWATALVRQRARQRIDPRTLALDLPAKESGYAGWLAESAAGLAAALREVDPETAVWSWGGEHSARFWARRAFFETTIHEADAAIALGRMPGIEAMAAVDGIDEFLENLPHAAAFAPKVAELRGQGESLHWHSTDAAGEWTVRLTTEGFEWARGHAKGMVAVRGLAADLLLLMWGRLPPADARFERFGDESLLNRWLENSAM
ncbi:MAG: maleylpyruvate isomerase family mycothiol-dependent enzyme [Chloroflexota bacterium]|nr:maleylpyruvate isomerase family mycothiol-dependent enzyme [Chloroflexota bacterium]